MPESPDKRAVCVCCQITLADKTQATGGVALRKSSGRQAETTAQTLLCANCERDTNLRALWLKARRPLVWRFSYKGIL